MAFDPLTPSKTGDRRLLWFAAVIFLIITGSPVGSWLESSMVGHVLIEIPLLISAGFALGIWTRSTIQRLLDYCDVDGIAGILLATFTIAFWMIPRWLDASLTDASITWLKYLSLMLMAGTPLAWSWSRLPDIARGLVKIELLTMLFRLGWLYLISPARLCNSYLLSDQINLGFGFLILGLALSIHWLIPIFFGIRESSKRGREQLSRSTQHH